MCGGIHYEEVEGLVSVERWFIPNQFTETSFRYAHVNMLTGCLAMSRGGGGVCGT